MVSFNWSDYFSRQVEFFADIGADFRMGSLNFMIYLTHSPKKKSNMPSFLKKYAKVLKKTLRIGNWEISVPRQLRFAITIFEKTYLKLKRGPLVLYML